MTKKLGGGPAFKVWIPKSLQKAMRRIRPFNWSAYIRGAIEKKIREMTR